MPKPKTTTPKPEAKGEEQEQPTPETEEAASPPKVEAEEQRGEETPDPLTGFTTEQLREHSLFKEASADLIPRKQADEERDTAYREGQRAAAKQADEKTREFAAAQQAIKVFDDLEEKRLAGVAGDPDAGAEYARAMGDPKAKEAYERGRSAKQGPGAQEIANSFLTGLDAHLDELLELQKLSDEEKASLDKKNHPTLAALVDAKIKLATQRGTATGRVAEDAKQLKEAREEGRREAYDEMGLKYPGPEIEGAGAPPGRKQLPTKQELRKMSQEEVDELSEEDVNKVLAGKS